MKSIVSKLDPIECLHLIIVLTKRDVRRALRQLENENFPENWNEISNSHCLESLVNWNERIPKSLSRGLLKKALYKLGKSDLVAYFNQELRSPSSERKIKHNEFHRNGNFKRNSREGKKTKIIEYNDGNLIIYMIIGSLIILTSFGFLLLVIYIRAIRSNFHSTNCLCGDENRKNCHQKVYYNKIKLNTPESSGIESDENSLNQSMINEKIKETPREKKNNNKKYSKKRLKLLLPFLKLKKLFTLNKKKGNRRKNSVKYSKLKKNICQNVESKEKKKKSKKSREKINTQNSDIEKIVFHKLNEICTCEMCQLFNIDEDKFTDIRAVDYIRSRKRQRRKIRK